MTIMEAIRQKREQAFLESPGDTYAIYQLKRDDATTDLRFMDSEWLKKKGIEPQLENYDLVYTGALYPASTQIDTLERLYQTFNIDHPTDFTGHSLSVSDIVALKQNGVVSCHYVDSVGYKAIHTMCSRYGVEFHFCHKDETGDRIIDILTAKDRGPYT